MGREIPANHSPRFAPLEVPTLLTATRAHVVAALAYVGAERPAVAVRPNGGSEQT